MVVKITQVGTVSEAMEACRYCLTHGYNVHPCGSRGDREDYLALMERSRELRPQREQLSCGNLAHGFAACGVSDKAALSGDVVPNLGIITAYKDMLSAHQPFERFRAEPAGRELGKRLVRVIGAAGDDFIDDAQTAGDAQQSRFKKLRRFFRQLV